MTMKVYCPPPFGTRMLVRRPTGLELHQVLLPLLIPQVLIVSPEGRAQFGGWNLDEAIYHLKLEQPKHIRTYLKALSNTLVPICHKRRCTDLSLRFESNDIGWHLDPGHLPSRFQRTYRYTILSTPLDKLKQRISETPFDSLARGLKVDPVKMSKVPTQQTWLKVPDFDREFRQLFQRIFTPGTDREISDAPSFQLGLLELILGASWQTPALHMLRFEGSMVGMLLSRSLEQDRGELSFVGLERGYRGHRDAGTLLIAAGVAALENSGSHTVVCAVADDNPRSMAFFRHRWGFIPVGSEEVWKCPLR